MDNDNTQDGAEPSPASAGSVSAARLTDGFVVRKVFSDGRWRWPAIQDIRPDVEFACEVCPIRKFCGDNNEFDCQVYEMFSGFYLEDEFVPVFDNRYSEDEAIVRSGAAVG